MTDAEPMAATPGLVRDLDLLVLGELNPDVVVAGAPERPAFGQAETLVEAITLTVGSSSAIAACGAARLGLRVAFVGVVGDDAAGRFMLETLAARDIDVSACRVDTARPTGASVILGRGPDRAILTALGTIDALRADDVPAALLRRARHVHVGSLYLQSSLRPGLAEILATARAAGATVSLDPNWDPTGRWAPLDDLLAETDLLLPNGAELRALTGEDDLRSGARALAARGRDGLGVVVKLGRDGAIAFQGPAEAATPALAVPVVDSTGAGDSFDAGFIAGTLAGWPLAACLDLAVACGSLSTTRLGGVDGQPTLAEAGAMLSNIGRPLPSAATR
jgi:sugar/nucleoside kinase (ribokinase family)